MELHGVVHSIGIHGVDITKTLRFFPRVTSEAALASAANAQPDTQIVICGTDLAIVDVTKKKFRFLSCSYVHPVVHLKRFAIQSAERGMYQITGFASRRNDKHEFSESYRYIVQYSCKPVSSHVNDAGLPAPVMPNAGRASCGR